MATVAKTGIPTVITMALPNNCRVGSGLICGEDLGACDACYIKASDGLVYKSNGTAANAAAKVRGFSATACKVAQNDAVTLLTDVDFRYGAGMTPGADLFASATAGALDDAATSGGTAPVGFVVDATTIRVFQSRY